MPDITGKSIKEAETILKEKELQLEIQNQTEEIDKENTIINNQVPKAGIKIYQGSKVYGEY